MLTVGSTFSGIGGFDLAAERAGLEVSWSCEINADARQVLEQRFPGVKIYEDVTEIGGPDAPIPVAEVDVLCGGFPCQDLSVAGKRAGLEGARSNLFFDFAQILDELRPRWFVLENVPGLLSSNGGRDMGTIIGTLGQLGYGVAWRVLDAQNFGVPQRRRRVVIVGHLGDAERAAKVLFEPEGGGRHPAPGDEAGPGSSAAVTCSTLQGGGKRGYRVGAEEAAGGQLVPVVASAVAGGVGGGGGPDASDAIAGHLIPEVVGALMSKQSGWRIGADEAAVGQLIPEVAPGGGMYNQHGYNQWSGPDKAAMPLQHRDWKSAKTVVVQQPEVYTVGLGSDVLHARDLAQPVTGRNGDPGVVAYPLASRQSLLAYAPTVTPTMPSFNGPRGTTTNPQFTDVALVAYRKAQKAHHSEDCERWEEADVTDTLAGHGTTQATAIVEPAIAMKVRRLIPVECERLQGFPSGWTDVFNTRGKPMPDSSRYRMLGNAVAVPVFEWVFRRLAEVDAAEG